MGRQAIHQHNHRVQTVHAHCVLACGVQTVQTDIHHLLKSVQEGDNDAIQADAAGLQKEFEALRAAIPKVNGKQND